MKDLSPVLRSMKDKNPDAFVGFTYPPDTILASKQAKEVGFNPKFFYASVGTAFQLYKNVMTPAGAEGVLGMGSWNSKTSPGAKAYFDAHTKKFGGKEPDRWASGACWAGLEILTAAVGKVGPGPQGDPRLRGQHHAQDHPGRHQVHRQREHRHAGHGEPVAERRVRGGVAAEGGDGQAEPDQAGLEVSPPFGLTPSSPRDPLAAEQVELAVGVQLLACPSPPGSNSSPPA